MAKDLDEGSYVPYGAVAGAAVQIAFDAALAFFLRDALLGENMAYLRPMVLTMLSPLLAFAIPLLLERLMRRKNIPSLPAVPETPSATTSVSALFLFLTIGTLLIGAPLDGMGTAAMLGCTMTLTLVLPSMIALRFGRVVEETLSLFAADFTLASLEDDESSIASRGGRLMISMSLFPGLGAVLGCLTGACFSVLDWNYMWRDWPRPSWMCCIAGRCVGCVALLLAQFVASVCRKKAPAAAQEGKEPSGKQGKVE